MANAFELIEAQIADPDAQWSLGTFGAIAEFARDADEPAEIAQAEQSISVVTPRGGLRIDARPDLRPVAFETVTTSAWSQRVAFCLPEAASAMNRRAALTEIGPDRGALRALDASALLFDLGLGVHQVDCCVRTAEPELIAGLRAAAGRSLFESGNPAMGLILRHGPHRVFATRAGRAEVYQPIPAPGGTVRIPMCCRSCWRTGVPMRRPSRSRAASFPVRISTRRIRCATAMAVRSRSTPAAMRRSSGCSRASATSSMCG